MLNRLFGNNFHDNFHLFGICALAIGLPTSKVILSLGMMLLILNLILEGSFASYWQNLKSNKFFHFLLLFWSFHLISLIWTTDFNYAWNDIRIKLTMLIIPLIFSVKPIQKSTQLLLILGLFITTLIFTSFYNFASYQHWIGNKVNDDIRSLSLFGSHIRYGILIAIGGGICLYYIKLLQSPKKWIFLPILLWFSYYTYFSQIISGLLALIVIILTFLIFEALKKSISLGIATLVISIAIFLVPFLFLLPNEQTESFNYVNLESKTAKGNPYSHYLGKDTYIDGKPVLAYVCEEELREEWNKKSVISYDSIDLKGQPLRFTLMRFMTSKNLKKDAEGFSHLTKQDINNVEHGLASVNETKIGILARLEGIKFQLHHSVDPNGHSLLQRIEFWKTGIQIIKNNWFWGVGTGDVQQAFLDQYKVEKTSLLPENQLRAHNTFLTTWISFGIVGFVVFCWMILYFLKTHWKIRSFLPVMFILVACSTFFIEDTLETQIGVSFFAFFYGLFSQKNLHELMP
jgi:hypothetical protein